MPAPRAVLDNNLTYSFLLTGGPTLTRLFEAWRDERFVYVVSPPILEEMRRITAKLASRGGFTRDGAEHVRRIERRAERTPGAPLVRGACRDPKDDVFLSCALEGIAEYVVTGDRDLLDMQAFRGIRMVTPVEFLILLEMA